MKSKKLNQRDTFRKWGFSEEHIKRMGGGFLRYKNPIEKGIYWYYFSLFIRERDVERYGTCISCGNPITVETSNAGHFMPAESCGRDLLFDPLNVNAECAHCNAWDSTHLLGYAENLDERYGPGTSQKLRQRRADYLKTDPPLKDWKAAEYALLIEKLPTYQRVVQSAK